MNEMINRLEALAKLALTDEEKETVSAQIGEVIDYFNRLSALDTAGIEPLTHGFGAVNVLRADEVKPSLTAEEVTANADSENGFFTVPAAVEEG